MIYKKYVLPIFAFILFLNCHAMEKDINMVGLNENDIKELIQKYINGRRSKLKKEDVLDKKTKEKFWTSLKKTAVQPSKKKQLIGKIPTGKSELQELLKEYAITQKKDHVNLFIENIFPLILNRIINALDKKDISTKKKDISTTIKEFRKNLLTIVRAFEKAYPKENEEADNGNYNMKNPETVFKKEKIHNIMAELISKILYVVNNNLPEINDCEEGEEEISLWNICEKEKEIISYEQTVLLEEIENILLLYGYTHPSSDNDLFFFLYAHTYNKLLALLNQNSILTVGTLLKTYPNMLTRNGKNLYKKYYLEGIGDIRIFETATKKLLADATDTN